MRQKSHNFRLVYAPRDKHKKGTDTISIYLEYTHGYSRKRVSTKVRVPKASWNVKKACLELKSYPHLVESQQRLDEIISQSYIQARLLDKKKVSVETAIEEILQLMPDESILEYYDEWYKKEKGVKYSTYKQRRGIITAVQNKMQDIGRKEYAVLKFEHLADDTSIKRIGNIIKSDEFGLEPNGANGYMKKLDEIYNKKYPKTSPFKTAGMLGTYEHPDNTGVTFINLILGSHKIKTLQDLEAYLFFLYSLCLRGLNGKDIFRMRDEDFIAEDEDTITNDMTYIPNTSIEWMDKKMHYNKRRGKSNNKMKILANMFPTPIIRKWLQWVVEIERPELCRTPNEGYAIFREFSEEEVYSKWSKGVRPRITENLNNLIGKGINSARHTYTQNGDEAGIPYNKLQASMGQVPNELRGKSLRNYLDNKAQELDLVHIDVLDECQIVELYYQLVISLKDKKPFRGSRQTFFPKWFKKEHNKFLFMDGERLGIQGWNYKDEFRLQKLEEKYSALCFIDEVRRGRIKITSNDEGQKTIFRTLRKSKVPVPKELLDYRERKKNTKKLSRIVSV